MGVCDRAGSWGRPARAAGREAGQGPEQTLLILFLNGLVLVPVLMATRFFFPARPGNDPV
jgi:hypothetical protein